MIDDPLQRMVVCLCCGKKMQFGKLICDDIMRCPQCNSGSTHPMGEWPDAPICSAEDDLECMNIKTWGLH